MNRKEIKKCARKSLRKNYFRTLIVVFIFGLIVGGGYNFGNKVDFSYIEKGIPESSFISSYLVKPKRISDIAEDIFIKEKGNTKEYRYTKGFLAPIINNMVESNSVVLGLFSSISLFINNKIDNAIVSLITLGIITLLYLFSINIIYVGKARYFLEQRRYKDTSIGRLIFPAKVKKKRNVIAVLLFVDIKLFLWCLTIIGGFIKYYEYKMVDYILAENPNIKARDAIKLSSQMMKGNKWNTFIMDISFLFLKFIDVFTLGLLSFFFINMYREACYAEIYMKLRKRKDLDKDLKEQLCDEYLDIDEFSDKPYPDDKYFIKIDHKELINSKQDDDYTLTTYVLMFFIFSFVGWSWEVILHMVQFGKYVNRGALFGPWLPIYGWGGVITLYALKSFKKKPKLYFIASMILCGFIEYITSLYLEIFKNLHYWDYTGSFLNINGRICFEGVLLFGIGCMTVGYLVGPFLNTYLKRFKEKILIPIAIILVALFLVDNVYSNIKPHTGDGITDGLIASIIDIDK